MTRMMTMLRTSFMASGRRSNRSVPAHCFMLFGLEDAHRVCPHLARRPQGRLSNDLSEFAGSHPFALEPRRDGARGFLGTTRGLLPGLRSCLESWAAAGADCRRWARDAARIR